MNEDERLQEIQDRLKRKLASDLQQKTHWNQTAAFAWCPEHDKVTSEFHSNALDDMVWLMQQYVELRAMYVIKLTRIAQLQDELRQEDE